MPVIGLRWPSVWWRLCAASSRPPTDSGVTLEVAAIKNLQKIFDRWPRERRYPPAFDEDKDAEEQLPRVIGDRRL